eukprot:TRINITY_DN5216_c0_g1_i1.p1 TRINITY_DN5216_c0_g1~~TRINITY_DN5216_c0_g1_i1.p1  ORF type:complete len:467 (+),score=72.68 TRINITY_DN5216_c0_g1_i1:75-1475(+)
MFSYVQTFVSAFFLFFIVLMGYAHNISQKLHDFWEVIEILVPHHRYAKKSKTGEGVNGGGEVGRGGGGGGEHKTPRSHNIVKWHSEKFGYIVEEYNVTTEDGFILHLERIKKKTDTRNESATEHQSNANTTQKMGRPVILQHGLFQSSGIFVVANKHKSLAYFLVDLGYDVWLGNNRGVYNKHSKLSTNDEAYWDWNLHELGRYDFPALIKFVAQQTKQKVVYVGHSQGNAQAFVGFSLNPDIAQHVDLFVAMAPAYYVNQFRHWSLRFIQKLPDRAFWLLFGSRSFIEIMHPCQAYLPHRMFSSFAYTMFAYLFGWTSDKWKRGLKPTIFQTTPRPISTKLIKHWLAVSKTGKLAHHDPDSPQYCEYLLSNIHCPVAVFWGKSDSLVDGEKLLKSLKADGVSVVFEVGVEGYEHMDLIWAEDAVQKVFEPLVGLLEKHTKKTHSTVSNGKGKKKVAEWLQHRQQN